jgi:hypothetical protein
MRHAHVCPHCDHRSTRWWNLKVHIKRKHGGFLFDRSSDLGSNPLYPNNTYNNIGFATVTDSVGDSFQPRYIRQQAPVETSQYFTGPIHRPSDDQNYGNDLSQKTKLGELKRLVYKYPQFHNNSPDEIVRWAIYWSSNGDDTILDDLLEQLRSIDRLANNNF